MQRVILLGGYTMVMATRALGLILGVALLPSLASAADNLVAQPLSGPAPTIDGNRAAGEWTGTPTLSLTTPTYPITTNVYFRHDPVNLYVLVEALGDVNDNNLDECLLVFGLPPNHKIAEMWKDGSGVVTPNPGTVATAYAMGMTDGHRVYEFRIPFSGLGLQPGQSIPFYSPKIMKGPGWYGASIPYDAQDARDNEYPSDLQVTTEFSGSGTTITGVTGYSALQMGDALAIPTLSDIGLLLTALGVLGVGAVIGRRKPQD